MFKFSVLATMALLPFTAYSHTNYCDHTHNRDGSITWDCGDDNDSRYVIVETCHGIDALKNPVEAVLQHEYWGSNPTHSWKWVINSKNEQWEIYSYGGYMGFYKNQLTVFSVRVQGQRQTHSYTGNSDFGVLRKGPRVSMYGTTKANLNDSPIPGRFDFDLQCRTDHATNLDK